MNEGKFMIPFGSIFVACGLLVMGLAFTDSVKEQTSPLIMLVFGGLFLAAGLAVVVSGIKSLKTGMDTLKFGKRYKGKIFRYENDPGIRINGYPAIILVVRFFEESDSVIGNIREVWIKTGGRNMKKYAIGNTIEVAVNGYDAQMVSKTYKSVKDAYLPGQERLMSNMEMSTRLDAPQTMATIPEYNYNAGVTAGAYPAANAALKDVLCPGCGGIVSLAPGSRVICPNCGRNVGLTVENEIV